MQHVGDVLRPVQQGGGTHPSGAREIHRKAGHALNTLGVARQKLSTGMGIAGKPWPQAGSGRVPRS